DWQACSAALKPAERTFTDCGRCTPPSANDGSGRFGTPCARMHATSFSTSPCSLVLSCPPAPEPGPPPGSSLRHACWADLKCGLPVMPDVTLTFTLTELPVAETCGSGKSGTPCARIQAPYA